MTLLCSLSSHDAVPVELENQGFQFSRCRRCHRDLIRSAASPAAEWQTIPAGFRVAWRGTDVSVFGYDTLMQRASMRVRHALSTAQDATYLLSAVVGWRLVDTGRQLRTTMRDAYRTGTRGLRTPRLAAPKRQWVVVVSVPSGRTLRLEPGDAGPGDATTA